MTIAPSGGKPGTCPTCGAENAPGSRFCERCGTRLPPASREAAGPTPAAPTDATLTFDRPQVGTPRDDQDQAAAATPMDAPAEDRSASTNAASEQEEQPPVARDAPTMSFDLPNLPAPEVSEPRNAATLSFDLPSWAKEGEGDKATPSEPQAAEPQAAETQAAETGWPSERGAATPATDAQTPAQEGKSWDYQPWTPQSPAEQAAAPPPREIEGTRPAIVLQPEQAADGGSERQRAADTATPPSESPATPAPPAQPAAQPPGSGWYGNATPPPPQAQGQGQGSYTYPSPPPGLSGGQLPPTTGSATPPAYGYPQSGATAWSPPNTGAYPAPAVGNSNRTLWIILGVVGGLLLLCAMICVLIFLVGVASASGTGAVATGVATTTRP